jgi:DNA-binding NtrC family response regulator
MIFADVRLGGVMDGIDLAREVKMRWPFLPVTLTSRHSRERVGELPPGVAYMPKPWQPLNVLIAAEQALAFRAIVKAGRKPAGKATIALVPSWTRETIPNASTTAAIEALPTAALLWCT